MFKVCCKCKKELPKTEFYKDNRNLDGLYYSCKKCENEKRKEWQRNNSDKVKKYYKTYSNRKGKEIRKRYREKNREKIKKRNKKYYLNNKDKFKELSNNYREIVIAVTCIICNKLVVKNGKRKYCDDCLKRNKIYKRNYNKSNTNEYIVARVCIDCGEILISSHKQMCDKCYKEHKRKLSCLYVRKYTLKNKEKVYRKLKNIRKGFSMIGLIINPFPSEIKVNYHHINNILAIPIPEITHRKCYCNSRTKHREKLKPIIEDIYQIDLNKILIP